VAKIKDVIADCDNYLANFYNNLHNISFEFMKTSVTCPGKGMVTGF
jgi:hypothetical protein